MGNHLFPIKGINKDFDEIFMAEDHDLCAKPKQHKLKILFQVYLHWEWNYTPRDQPYLPQ